MGQRQQWPDIQDKGGWVKDNNGQTSRTKGDGSVITMA